ncbi:MAG: hypothetical protein ACTTJV_09010 [Ottowia sp.]
MPEVIGATGDFLRNYSDMRQADTINGDKYFHCKANCEASRRGKWGEATACTISSTREVWDRNIKDDTLEQSAKDEFANAYGRRFGSNFNIPCDLACSPFRPPSFVGRGIK